MELEVSFTVHSRLICWPIRHQGPACRATLMLDDQIIDEFLIELTEEPPDCWVATDMIPYRGQEIRILLHDYTGTAAVLDGIQLRDQLPDAPTIGQEAYRPLIHYTPDRGWINDPNGLVYDGTAYHLFYQHNPYGHNWGNMHWGHAVSPDLIHWQQWPETLHPDAMGTMYSGSAVIDTHNTTGFQTDDIPPIVIMYTAAGGTSHQSHDQPYTQCLAYSNDNGYTWEKYAGNPVMHNITQENRDPKVCWYAPEHKWVMVLYLDDHDYGIFDSPDMLTWRQTDTVTMPDQTECPDLFPLAVDGNPADIRWVFWGAKGDYLIGTFDGMTFHAESELLSSHAGGDIYAAQTFNHIPEEDGRRMQMAWGRFDLPDMPFNHIMTFPTELTLRSSASGVRLHTLPVREVVYLYDRIRYWEEMTMESETIVCDGGEALDMEITWRDHQGRLIFDLHGVEVLYDGVRQTLCCLGREVPMEPVDGILHLRILLDRTYIELYGNEGAIYLPMGYLPSDRTDHVAIHGEGTVDLELMQIRVLKDYRD